MPNKDGTGLRGNGPKTGRGLGKCEGEAQFQRGLGGRNCCKRQRRGFKACQDQ